jgi:hypothetical protein
MMREFFLNGMKINHTRYNTFTATVVGVDRDKNELYVDLESNDPLSNGHTWREVWNLAHTVSGIRNSEYTWDRSECEEYKQRKNKGN